MSEQKKPGFEIKDIPNALIGIFGIRTEDELPYDLLEKEGNFEIRLVRPHCELEIVKQGPNKLATDRAFEDLLAYIKGGNREQKKFEMTAPVFERKTENGWRTAFFLRGNLKDLPAPLDPNLNLQSIPQTIVAVVRFSGSANQTEVNAQEVKLRNWINSRGLQTQSKARLAQFDPPFAIPFLRRNEIQIEISG